MRAGRIIFWLLVGVLVTPVAALSAVDDLGHGRLSDPPVLVTPVAALSAVGSAGAGHGHYEAARVLFPYAMLLTRMAGDTITLPLLVLALAQFPCYGATIGFAASKGRTALALVPLLAAHVAAVVLCFSGVIPNFS